MKNQLFYGDNLEVLRKYIKDESVDLCYFDSYPVPAQSPKQEWNKEDEMFFLEIISSPQNNCTPQTVQWIINFERILGKTPALAFLVKNALLLTEVFKKLKKTGSCYIHLKTNLAPYLQLLAEAIFTTQKGILRNEIVLCYEKSVNTAKVKRTVLAWKKRYWQPLHETLLFYTKSRQYYFQMPFEDKSYWQLRLSSTEQEMSYLGYKCSFLIYQIIKSSSQPNDVVLDVFGQAGTLAIEANELGRNWILIESNEALQSLIAFRLFEKQIEYQTN